MKETYFFWVGNKTGYVFSTNGVCPILKPKERLKYLGFTTDTGFPKRMNTGRLLHRPNYKSKKKRKKRLSEVQKTDTIPTANIVATSVPIKRSSNGGIICIGYGSG